MQRDLFKGAAAGLPPLRPDSFAGESEDIDVAHAAEPFAQPTATTSGTHGNYDYSPLSWSSYFDRETDLDVPDRGRFRVYSSGTVTRGQPLFVLHHGGGHSALSWALCARSLRKLGRGEAAVMAFDCRGHGRSSVPGEDDLSLDALAEDLFRVISTFVGSESPDIFLVGHSMGGPVVVRMASQRRMRIQGVVVIDVVEGTALESVQGFGMRRFLDSRPTSFASPEELIRWSYDSGTVRNLESARVSMPPQAMAGKNDRLFWRTNLHASEKYWIEWFTGMSSSFLTLPAAKLLVLAGTDRLDKDLMVGQMQGKFQLVVLPAAGHVVQEDLPDHVAQTVYSFARRNQGLDISAIRRKAGLE